MHTLTLPPETIERKIYFLRGKKVMFDSDLAQLYRVSTKVLNQAVKRNGKRFPEDFMFRLNKKEIGIWKNQFPVEVLRSQIVTLEGGRGKYSKYLPYVFTEQGVAMLSSVLKNEIAIQVNIQIMRTFTKLREMLMGHRALREKIEKLERKYDKQFRIIFEVLKKLLKDEEKPGTTIGFKFPKT